MAKCLLKFEELRTSFFLTPNLLIYMHNDNKKCFDNNESLNVKKDDVQNTFQYVKLVLENFIKQFEDEFPICLQEFQ